MASHRLEDHETQSVEAAAGYKAPTCECGHAEGDHVRVMSRQAFGRRALYCLVTECGCPEFRETTS